MWGALMVASNARPSSATRVARWRKKHPERARAQTRAAKKRWRLKHHDQALADRQRDYQEKYKDDPDRRAYMAERRKFRAGLIAEFARAGVPPAVVETLREGFTHIPLDDAEEEDES